MLLVTVPLSYTFTEVSIPTVQLLMRGDVLLVAPLVDLMLGRRVLWYHWVALFLVALGLGLSIGFTGQFGFPPLLIFIVVVYTVGYLIRIAVMTQIAKSDEDEANMRYFVEERLVSIPVAIGALGLMAAFGSGKPSQELAWGFSQIWTSQALPVLAVIALSLFLITFFAAAILLDKHENSYCVPLERSASILAGTAAAYVLAFWFDGRFPSSPELVGAVLLITAIVILALGPKWGGPKLSVSQERQ
jgi:hypothetical protein